MWSVYAIYYYIYYSIDTLIVLITLVWLSEWLIYQQHWLIIDQLL